jgi:hypothetical protein
MSIDVAIGILSTQVIIHTYLTVAILAHRNGEIGVVDDAVLGSGGLMIWIGARWPSTWSSRPGVVPDDKDRRFRPVLAVRDLVDPLA